MVLKWSNGAVCGNRLLIPMISKILDIVSDLPIRNLLKSPNQENLELNMEICHIWSSK